jgi:hypothetical protein
MMRRGAVKAVIAALILCATPAAARADEFTELAAKATDEIYLYAPALTRETCEALVAASFRHVLINLLIQRPKERLACDVFAAPLMNYYTLEDIPKAFALFDFRQVGEGPDIEHLRFTYDPPKAETLFSAFWTEAMKSPEAEEETRRELEELSHCPPHP